MGNEAWERAVEAGAEALCRIVHPGRFANGFDYWRSEWIKPATKEAFRKEAADCLRAAFPILVEELARDAEAGVKMLKAAGASDDGVRGANAIALSLRARIEQMIG